MGHLRWVASVVALLGWASAGRAAAEEWQLAGRGVFEEARVSAVATAPGQPTLLYAASGSTVYVSRDGGQAWQASWRAPAQTRVTDVAIDPTEPTRLLAATEQGLYGSFDGGAHWALVLRGAAEGQNEATVVAFHPQRPGMALAGTRNGVFVSEDGGRQWKELGVPQEARAVSAMSHDPADADRLWLVAAGGLFVGSLSAGQWQRRFGLINTPEEAPIETGQTDEVSEPEQPLERLNAVARDPTSPAVYMATSRGAHVSLDAGATWQRLPQHGLPSAEVSRLLVITGSPTRLYAGTARGVAYYEPVAEQWQTLTQGLSAAPVNDLAATATHVWAATDQGLYRAALSPPPSHAQADQPSATPQRPARFAQEPTIRQVQEVAVRYAEVHPEKIAQWRQQARLRALIPKFTTTSGTNLTDFRHWDSGTNPDTLLTGKRDIGWTASLTWELGDMIYSADQTSIDVRSKLMVQLRDDIVDEVTRTYFERRRVQLALLSSPPNDPEKRMEQELRVEELTALIDGLTGGWFSREIERRADEHTR